MRKILLTPERKGRIKMDGGIKMNTKCDGRIKMKKETITMKLTPVYIVCFILFLPSLLSGDPQYVFLSDYYNSGHTISRCNLDGSGYMRLLPYDTSQYTGYVGEIAVDNESQMVYWNSWSEIRRCSFDGSNLETVPIPTEYWLGGIAIGGDKLYWTQDSVIKSANLDGSNSQDLVTGLGKCFSLAFDNVYDKLYYIGYEDKTWEKGHIYSADPDGSNIEQLVSNLDLAVGLAVDPYNEKLYWTSRSSSYNSIKSANLDGTGITDLITSQQNPLVSGVQHIDIDWLGNKLYWTDQSGGGKTQRMNPDGTGYEVIHYGNAPYGIAVSIPEAMVINVPPVACVAGGDRAVEVGSGCEARVILDGSCSSDLDSTPGTNDDINDFDWYVVDACDPNYEDYLGSGEVIECNLPLDEHDIILEVTDKAGAFDANEVTITVEDTTPPVLTCPDDIAVSGGFGGAEVTYDPTATDECDANPAVTTDIASGSFFETGVTTVTATATDSSGNSSMCTFDVIVPCFGVNEVKIKTEAGKKGDDIKIKGTFNPGVPIDLMIDDVMYTIDDGQGHVFSFLIPAGSFELEGKGDKDKYKFHLPKGSVPEIEAKFDFDKCKFEFKAKKAAGIDEITRTSLEIILQAGANIAQEIVELEVKGKKGEHLEYKRKPKFECCPEM